MPRVGTGLVATAAGSYRLSLPADAVDATARRQLVLTLPMPEGLRPAARAVMFR